MISFRDQNSILGPLRSGHFAVMLNLLHLVQSTVSSVTLKTIC
eukprot:UN14090